ncbi:amidohydrolase family protein [Actinacidiphila bryophytorum]|uniref:L-fuconolactonase n=1 Tax=Actinacidiphila bryophytorum TaxID=1436133 RepID=A0A9W4ML07_9ACTN|nr:amidohydrolase family protein [Actinacidiphila bryophytorum]MBM9437790.1 amidohydrolase family protein [Actinacidiphila bryophytorum]MBN6545606.1 amidohydrolase family protein [Actinacidiphila bryophytorum]CAG7656965.1 L-fuconolactonase [Actinacidiphila bryophytorum]
MRIDAHHHLWDLTRRPQPWLTGPELDPIARSFDFAELQPLLDRHGIDATVVVQSSSSLDETRELLAVAEASGGRIAGVVGWADLTDPALPDVLASLTGPLVGIRHQVQDEPDPWWLARAAVRRGLATVAAAGLAYDLLVTPRELPAALETAAALPELRFVLDHAGKPEIASGGWEPWAAQLAALGALPNVSCKLSGLVTEATWAGWEPADLLPYARHVLDVFGPARTLFGSDWPVCTLAAPYGAVLAVAESAATGLSPSDRAALFGTTAARVYGL